MLLSLVQDGFGDSGEPPEGAARAEVFAQALEDARIEARGA